MVLRRANFQEGGADIQLQKDTVFAVLFVVVVGSYALSRRPPMAQNGDFCCGFHGHACLFLSNVDNLGAHLN